MADRETRLEKGVERTVGILIACWCVIPVFVVFGFFFWGAVEADWPWKLLFIAGALAVFLGFVIWGGALCAECRRRREGA